eukprot:3258436-Amphidinium_carterae.1
MLRLQLPLSSWLCRILSFLLSLTQQFAVCGGNEHLGWCSSRAQEAERLKRNASCVLSQDEVAAIRKYCSEDSSLSYDAKPKLGALTWSAQTSLLSQAILVPECICIEATFVLHTPLGNIAQNLAFNGILVCGSLMPYLIVSLRTQSLATIVVPVAPL